MKTGNETYKNHIPEYRVIFLKHKGNKIAVLFNYMLINNQQSEHEEEEESIPSLQFNYVIVPTLTQENLQQKQVPEAVIHKIFSAEQTIPWHEPNKSICIRLPIENMHNLLATVPQIARHSTINRIDYHVQAGYVHNYANFILPEHNQLLTAYSATIIEQ